jgi:hypothetical protein
MIPAIPGSNEASSKIGGLVAIAGAPFATAGGATGLSVTGAWRGAFPVDAANLTR